MNIFLRERIGSVSDLLEADLLSFVVTDNRAGMINYKVSPVTIFKSQGNFREP